MGLHSRARTCLMNYTDRTPSTERIMSDSNNKTFVYDPGGQHMSAVTNRAINSQTRRYCANYNASFKGDVNLRLTFIIDGEQPDSVASSYGVLHPTVFSWRVMISGIHLHHYRKRGTIFHHTTR